MVYQKKTEEGECVYALAVRTALPLDSHLNRDSSCVHTRCSSSQRLLSPLLGALRYLVPAQRFLGITSQIYGS